MIPQPTTATTTGAPFRSLLTSHAHVDNETCPWCEQEIPPEKLEEISGKIAARQRQQTQAITTKLEQQHALDKAQAEAKATADLDLERQQGAARVAAAREQARQAAEEAMADKLAEAERIREEQQAGLQQKVQAAEAARLAAERAGASLQTQLQQQLKDSAAALVAAKAEAAANEAKIRTEALSAARADAAEKIAVAERARQQSEAALNTRITTAEQKGVTLQAQLDDLQKAKDAAVAKVRDDAAAEATRIRQEAAEAAEVNLRDKLAEKEKAIIEAQEKYAEAETKLRTHFEQHERALQQRLEEQRDALEKAKDDAVNATNAKAFEETQKLQTKIAELQRIADKKSADELGEGAEIDLFEALRRDFPDDKIERVGKGTPGGDVLHEVRLNGRSCGTIIYDSKNRKVFQTEFVKKLAADKIAARAEHAILSTHKFPAKTGQLHIEDGVVLANPARVVAIVTLIREHMIRMHALRLSNAEREAKTDRLYAFMTSQRCGDLFGRVDSLAQDLLDQQVKERDWHERVWKKQGEALRAIQKTKGDLCAEIDGIVGRAADLVLDVAQL